MPDDKDTKSKILIVDDVPKNIQVVANILKKQGYSMAFAQSGAAAMELARNTPFDLILLDIMMPGMDGFEVCRQLVEDPKTRDIPVLFLTAKTDTESVVRGFDTGAVDYVTKPVNDAELLARVKTHLDLHSSKRRLMGMNRRLKLEIEERRRTEKRYRSMIENAVQGMFVSTLEGRILELNPAYLTILGYDSADEIKAIEDVSQVYFENPEDGTRMMDAIIKKGRLTDCELKVRRKDGTFAWVIVNGRLAKDDDGDPVIEGIVIDHTARKKAEEELHRSREKFRHQAIHDNLTGLYNTRYLYQALQKLITACSAKGKPLSLIFMDIDDFKQVVDTYGHLHGSQTLQEVARTIQSTLVEPAYGVAYGGDEFVVVLPGFDRKKAIGKAEEIRGRIRNTGYLANKGYDIHIRASLGIATYPDDATDVNGILALADKAMFHVKGRGKDAVMASLTTDLDN